MRRYTGCAYAEIDGLGIGISSRRANGGVQRAPPQIGGTWRLCGRPAGERSLFVLRSHRTNCIFRVLESVAVFRFDLQARVAQRHLSEYDPIILYGDIQRRVGLNLYNCVPRHGYLSEKIRFKIDARFVHANNSSREPIAVLEHHLSRPSSSCQQKINNPECRSHIASFSVLFLIVVRLTDRAVIDPYSLGFATVGALYGAVT